MAGIGESTRNLGGENANMKKKIQRQRMRKQILFSFFHNGNLMSIRTPLPESVSKTIFSTINRTRTSKTTK